MSRVTRRKFIGTATLAATAGSVLRGQAKPGDAVFLRCPHVQNVSAHEATILWSLPTLLSATVVLTDPQGTRQTFAATANYFDTSATGMDQNFYLYRATLSGMTPGTLYSYQVHSDAGPLPTPAKRLQQFRTASAGTFRFLHFADSGEGSPQQVQLSEDMCAEDVSFVLANGDLAYDLATHSSIEANYYGMYRDMMAQIPFFATLGNHEYYTDGARPSLSGRVLPTVGVAPDEHGRYYSFDWGNAHFVALDSNLPLEKAANGAGAMLDWLERDLSSTRKFWRVVYFHHPGYATGKHQDGAEAARVREHIVPILERHGVQLVFNGHEHTYQRTFALRGGQVVPDNSNGIVYVTSGGGGAQTYWSAPNERIVKSIGTNHYIRTEVAGPSLSLHTRGLGEAADIDGLNLQPAPRIISVTNSADFTPLLASGAMVTVFGMNLFPETVFSTLGGAPEALGCSLTLNGKVLPILFGDALQINAQLPSDVTGSAVLRVSTPNGAAEMALQIQAVAPALFVNPLAPEYVLATCEGLTIDAQQAVEGGQSICLFLSGLGMYPKDVAIWVSDAQVNITGLTDIGNGIYQVRLVIPALPHSGLALVQAVVDGISSSKRALLLG